MKLYGIIGYPLAHSFSQKYFSEKFLKLGLADHEYKTFPIANISEFPKIISENPALLGLSVTIPHKQAVIPCLNELDETARIVGAVNCIKIVPSPLKADQVPRLVGYNTDVFGFQQAIKPFLESHHSRALILGTGGASKAVAFVLSEIGVDFHFVTRNQPKARSQKQTDHKNIFNYSELNKSIIDNFPLIINTTPVGMFPNITSTPQIPYEHLTSKNFCFDLIYNPEKTLFLQKAKEKGALTQNGLTMLHQQAEKAWEIWNLAAGC